jgi:opacity protein-like surface antigen
MKFFSAVFAGLLLQAGAAIAADIPAHRPPKPQPVRWEWTGAYFGAHVGGGLGQTQLTQPAVSTVYGNDVRTPTAQIGGQFGYNWQMPGRDLMFGIEGDISAIQADGTNTCLATSGIVVSATCRIRQDALATLTGRLGLVTGASGRTLFYAKGGAAWIHETIDVATARRFEDPFATTQDGSRWGWTVGLGVEQAVAPAWTVKMEYDYADFGRADVRTPYGMIQTTPPIPDYGAIPPSTASAQQNLHTFKLGLNMKFGGDATARFADSDTYHLPAPHRNATASILDGIEIGGRVWYSSGRFQKDLGSTVSPLYQNTLNSRLTYQSTAASGEMFGRIDGLSNTFLKGFIGGGNLLSGKMNDEDWMAGEYLNVPYTNTLSDPVKGNIAYGTIDGGVDLVRSAGYRIGGFVGYNYYRENKAAYGCRQTVNQSTDSICVSTVPNSTPVIVEDDKWQSLRVGLNGVVMLNDRLKLTADAAYLPYVKFNGVDDHLLRSGEASTRSPESGTGQGVQLETILSYNVTRAFSVGAGARYWAMWATDDNAVTNAFGAACPCQTLPSRTERYGGFLEASYKFDGLP